MGHCSCGAHSCAAEKKVDAKVSVFHEYGKVIFSLLLLAGGIIMNALDLAFFREGYVSLIWYIVAYLPVGIPVMKEAWESIREKDYFSEFTLMVIATLGAFYIGEYPEGVAVMLFYTVGELFQGKAVDKAKRNIGALLDVRPEKALVLREGNLVLENPKKIKVGEVIEIKAGERVPLDGTMQNEVAAFNTAALTGESVPRNIRKGEEVLAGMIVTDKVIRLEVTRPFDKSALARILELVQNAAERKAPAELFIRKFARVYTPIVIILAVLIVLSPFVYSLVNPAFVFTFNDWLYRALVFLVISCPCALVVSIPLGYFGGIGAASRLGILFKGGNYLDAIIKINTVVFDKTGTLTKGTFDVQACKSAGDISEEELVKLIASVESDSTHPIAKAVVNYAKEQNIEVVLTSGRMPKAMLAIASEANANNYLICGNGAMIYDVNKEEIIYNNYLSKKKLLEIIKICEENSIYYNVYTNDVIVTKSLNYNLLYYQNENLKNPEEKRIKMYITEDIYNYVENYTGNDFLKITICDSDELVFKSIINKLKSIKQVDILEVSHMSKKMIKHGSQEIEIAYFYTEITNENANKWTAIEKLIEHLGIQKEEVVAIGDNINDEPMIRNAGLGVAMGNASPYIKSIAKKVVADNNSSGVAEAIKDILN